ncbi:MAG: energy-coupling factor ABC transporter ATP-binding protein, partial [Anaerolineales bacterium]|nr:energy-coupling factor ABC transporter ATP-binding protein [Anaerolineales bacterium]
MPVTHLTSTYDPPECEGDVLLVNDLHFAYPDGRAALYGVSLKLCAGDKAALVGPNGAGKSTLMLHLNGILRGRGEIHIAGMRLTREHLPRIRAMVGLVFQNPDDQLFSPTVFEDVAFGPLHSGLPEVEIRARVAAALAAVGMSAYKDRL